MKGNQVYRYPVVLLSFLAFSLTGGCAATNEDANAHAATKTAEVTSEEPHHGRAFKVGVLLPSGMEQANATLRNAIQAAAQSNNLLLNFETAQAQHPLEPVERLRALNVDALLLCTQNLQDTRMVMHAAGEREIPIVALVGEPQQEEEEEKENKAAGTNVKPLPKLLPGVVAEVMPRAPRVGKTLSQRLNDVLHGRGGIVLITSRLDAAADLAWNDLRTYLHRCPLLQVLEARPGPLPSAEGLKLIARHGSKLNAIVCDDETALRLLTAVCLQQKRADVALFAFDAHRATLTTVENTVPNSFQKAVVQQIGFAVPVGVPGKLAVQTVAATLRGEKPRPHMWADPIPVLMPSPSLFFPIAAGTTLKATGRSDQKIKR